MNFYANHIAPSLINAAMKQKAIQTLRPSCVNHAKGIVLEIGFGSGLNLSYYSSEVTKLYALEPSAEFYAKSNANRKNSKLNIVHIQSSAEKIPLPDNSVDSVVSTFVLCSIPNVKSALTEIYRVLKPGGVFIFLEHGLSPNTAYAFLQNLGTPFSKLCAGGCHLNRDITKLVFSVNFKKKKLEKFALPYRPLAYIYKGIAIKPNIKSLKKSPPIKNKTKRSK
jgi:ubiquinone/menaquinone biosynthesis C-methylase UbiE